MIEIDLYSISQFLLKITDQIIVDFSGKTPVEVAWIFLIKYWGWALVLYFFLRYVAYPEYMLYIQTRWVKNNVKMTILAVDVPKRNEQSVQAMENFFDHLQGAHGTITKWAKYIEGEFQLGFSCEIVSIEGNVQFLIRTPSHWRNLVEAAIYSQYPDAEITEVNDYVQSVPRWYPNDTHDIWGCEFSLSNKNVYLPIKTYTKFEHRFTEVFADPMAAMLENMSLIGPGENMWLQILIRPLEVGWGREGGEKAINKLLKIPPKAASKGILGSITELGAGLASEFTNQIAGITPASGSIEKKEESQFKMMNLTPGQKEQLEAIERKTAKLAFDTKVRYLYIAEKDKMNKALGVNGMVGVIKQWTDMNLNGFKPMLKETGTNSPQYILIDYRRNSRRNWLLGGYITRDIVRGMIAKPMCSEELASFWHFPSMYVKAPLLKKTEFTKVAAPVGLPFEERVPEAPDVKRAAELKAEKARVIPTFDYDSDNFEMQFAKDKKAFVKSRPDREKKLKEVAKEEAIKLKEIKKEEEKKPAEIKKSGKKEVKESGDKIKKEKNVEGKENGLPTNLPFLD
jgi:hypothetical protein